MRCLPHGIFQSDAKEASAADCAKLGIRGIINVAADETLVYQKGVSLLCLPVGETDFVDDHSFESAVNFYDKHKPVLVHCSAGVGRSRVFAAALLVAAGVKLDEAILLTEPPTLSRPYMSFKRWAKGVVKS